MASTYTPLGIELQWRLVKTLVHGEQKLILTYKLIAEQISGGYTASINCWKLHKLMLLCLFLTDATGAALAHRVLE